MLMQGCAGDKSKVQGLVGSRGGEQEDVHQEMCVMRKERVWEAFTLSRAEVRKNP